MPSYFKFDFEQKQKLIRCRNVNIALPFHGSLQMHRAVSDKIYDDCKCGSKNESGNQVAFKIMFTFNIFLIETTRGANANFNTNLNNCNANGMC